jgi:hypothetical protein
LSNKSANSEYSGGRETGAGSGLSTVDLMKMTPVEEEGSF